MDILVFAVLSSSIHFTVNNKKIIFSGLAYKPKNLQAAENSLRNEETLF